MPSRTRDEWIRLAKWRCLNTLATHSICPIRMIEAKVCEAGPGDKRPNPLSVSDALKQLRNEGRIDRVKHQVRDAEFFFDARIDINREPHRALFLNRLALYRKYIAFATENQLCGFVLEQVLDDAINRSGVATFVSRFPGCNIPQGRPLDSVFTVRGQLVGAEAKNLREWLYPESVEIWNLLSKCHSIDALPVLVARKLPYVTYLLFKKVGILGYQTHFQYFHPQLTAELESIKRVDGLGFKDIRTSLGPDLNLTRYIQNVLPRNLEDFKQRFLAAKPLVLKYCSGRGLANDKVKGFQRRQAYSDFWKELTGTEMDENSFV
ncbi:MAG TPA: hypothetical protein VNN18_05320 [Candidatus Xenobia bacterium]|nr:hypothetical protein [Candidatus Xenobia bacterium]